MENRIRSVQELVKPLAAILAPVFFVRMGALVDIRTLADPSVLAFAGFLTLAAILGKQVCSSGVLEKGVDRLSVGIGMIPRGEVGLIFAAIGGKLVLDGKPLISASAYSAVVAMLVVTTMLTPVILKRSLARRPSC